VQEKAAAASRHSPARRVDAQRQQRGAVAGQEALGARGAAASLSARAATRMEPGPQTGSSGHAAVYTARDGCGACCALVASPLRPDGAASACRGLVATATAAAHQHAGGCESVAGLSQLMDADGDDDAARVLCQIVAGAWAAVGVHPRSCRCVVRCAYAAGGRRQAERSAHAAPRGVASDVACCIAHVRRRSRRARPRCCTPVTVTAPLVVAAHFRGCRGLNFAMSWQRACTRASLRSPRKRAQREPTGAGKHPSHNEDDAPRRCW
jgi:hypothetical protein